jgi:hypothetical protein
MMKLFLNAGANVASRRDYGNALQQAAVSARIDAMQLLLEAGANINARGGSGSALNVAIFEGRYEPIKFLLDRSATITFDDDDAYGSALTFARSMNIPKITDLLLQEAKRQDIDTGDFGSGSNEADIHQLSSEAKSMSRIGGISVGALNLRIGYLFFLLKLGRMDAVNTLLTHAEARILLSIEYNDLNFLNSFYEALILHAERIFRVMNSEFINRIYALLQNFYERARLSLTRGPTLDGLRKTMVTIYRF